MLARRSKSSPARLAPINVFQAGGGLANAGRRQTLQQLHVLLDGRIIQDTTFRSPVNIADVTGGLPGILAGSHVLTLKVVRQTDPAALYQSYLLSVIVGSTNGQVLFQETFNDQYKPLPAGG
ncbi:MAG: hypothetical protein NEA02_10125, partial [Thermoanaerobaculia bacterium]|nr:hypothetical protein [Thermoanaerobaculia bacterium]